MQFTICVCIYNIRPQFSQQIVVKRKCQAHSTILREWAHMHIHLIRSDLNSYKLVCMEPQFRRESSLFELNRPEYHSDGTVANDLMQIELISYHNANTNNRPASESKTIIYEYALTWIPIFIFICHFFFQQKHFEFHKNLKNIWVIHCLSAGIKGEICNAQLNVFYLWSDNVNCILLSLMRCCDDEMNELNNIRCIWVSWKRELLVINKQISRWFFLLNTMKKYLT